MAPSAPVPPISRRSSPTVIGILGGISSGKSEVARLLALPRGRVIDADRLAGEVLRAEETISWLRAEFGPGIFEAGGRLDRRALARVVFEEAGARESLEGWIHPRVRERISASLIEARAEGRSPIVLDIPLLLENETENRLAGECDFLVFVETDPEERDRRAQERRGWSAGEVARRERLQLPLKRKRERAHHVIENRSGLSELAARVREVIEAENLNL
jgi:dephospho-CoA kinase